MCELSEISLSAYLRFGLPWITSTIQQEEAQGQRSTPGLYLAIRLCLALARRQPSFPRSHTIQVQSEGLGSTCSSPQSEDGLRGHLPQDQSEEANSTMTNLENKRMELIVKVQQSVVLTRRLYSRSGIDACPSPSQRPAKALTRLPQPFELPSLTSIVLTSPSLLLFTSHILQSNTIDLADFPRNLNW